MSADELPAVARAWLLPVGAMDNGVLRRVALVPLFSRECRRWLVWWPIFERTRYGGHKGPNQDLGNTLPTLCVRGIDGGNRISRLGVWSGTVLRSDGDRLWTGRPVPNARNAGRSVGGFTLGSPTSARRPDRTVFLGERVTPRGWIGILMIVMGVVVLLES